MFTPLVNWTHTFVHGQQWSAFLQEKDGEISIGVSQIIRHPRFDSSSLDYDLALLQLSSRAPISGTVNVACLPTNEDQPALGTPLTISGWGFEEFKSDGNTTSNLKSAQVYRVPDTNCTQVYKERNKTITRNMFCAGTSDFDADACNGDEGGEFLSFLPRWGYIHASHLATPSFNPFHCLVRKQ